MASKYVWYVFSVVFVGIKNVHVNQWDALLDTLVFGQRFSTAVDHHFVAPSCTSTQALNHTSY